MCTTVNDTVCYRTLLHIVWKRWITILRHKTMLVTHRSMKPAPKASWKSLWFCWCTEQMSVIVPTVESGTINSFISFVLGMFSFNFWSVLARAQWKVLPSARQRTTGWGLGAKLPSEPKIWIKQFNTNLIESVGPSD